MKVCTMKCSCIFFTHLTKMLSILQRRNIMKAYTFPQTSPKIFDSSNNILIVSETIFWLHNTSLPLLCRFLKMVYLIWTLSKQLNSKFRFKAAEQLFLCPYALVISYQSRNLQLYSILFPLFPHIMIAQKFSSKPFFFMISGFLKRVTYWKPRNACNNFF